MRKFLIGLCVLSLVFTLPLAFAEDKHKGLYRDDSDFVDSGSVLALVGGVYQSTPQSITDGDVGPFQVDSNGRLLVTLSSSSAGAEVYLDDADWTNSASSHALIGGVYTSQTVTAGDTAPLQIDANGAAIIAGKGTAGTAAGGVLTVQGAASMTAVQVGDNASSLTVDTTGTSGLEVVQGTAADFKATVYGAGSAGSADAGVMTVQGIGSATPVIVTGDSAGSLTIDGTITGITNTVTVTGDSSGSLTVDQATATNLNAQVVGSVAHDGAGTAVNPVVMGYIAETTVPSAASADLDVVRVWADDYGRQVVYGANMTAGAIDVNPVANANPNTFHYQIIDETLDASPTSVSSAWIWVGDCTEVGFWITADETVSADDCTLAVTVDISNDASNTLDGIFYDIAGTTTAQTSETISADGEYVFWLPMGGASAYGHAPYVQVDIAATNSDASDYYAVDVWIFGRK